MGMANGWIIVQPMDEREKLRDAASSFLKNCSDEQRGLASIFVDDLIAALEQDEGKKEEPTGDSTLYIEFTDRSKNKNPKRPNDGTRRKTVASGWFNDEDMSSFSSQPWYPYRNRIGSVKVLDPWAPRNGKYLFDGLNYCREFDLLKLDTSLCVSFEGMFRGCSAVTQLFDIDRLDTSNVEDVSYMFLNCLSLKAMSISGWDTSKIKNVDHMLSGCSTYVLASDAQSSFINLIGSNSAGSGVWRRTMQ